MLRCMSLHTSYIADVALSDSTSHLVRKNGLFSIRRQNSNTSSPGETLARVDIQHPYLHVEPLVPTILERDPAPSSNLTPACSTSPGHHLRLNDGDCLHFTDHYVKVLFTNPQQQAMPPLPSPMDDTQDLPREVEDVETDDDLDDPAIASKEAAVTKKSLISRPSGEKAGTPKSSMKPSEEEIADSEVMAQTPTARITYGGAAARRRRNVTTSDTESPTIATDAATRSANASARIDDGVVEDIPSSTGKLSAVKKGTKRKAPPLPQGAEETYQVSTEDEGRPSKKNRTRLPKVAREESPEDESNKDASNQPQEHDPEGEDEIREDEAGEEDAEEEDAEAEEAEEEDAEEEEAEEDEIPVAPRPTKKTRTKTKSVPQRSSKRLSATPAASKSPASTPSILASKPKILLSQCSLDGKTSSWIKKKVNVVDDIPGRRANYVCVTREKDIPTTVKVLKTLVAGKGVFCEKWIKESHKQGKLLDLNNYMHAEIPNDVDKDGRRSLFSGKTLFFTNRAMLSYGNGWSAIQEVAKDAGASVIEEGTAAFGDGLTPKASVILIGDGNDDPYVNTLIEEHGRTVYDKAMFPQAIIRAELDLDDDEFKLSGDGSKPKARGRKRK